MEENAQDFCLLLNRSKLEIEATLKQFYFWNGEGQQTAGMVEENCLHSRDVQCDAVL